MISTFALHRWREASLASASNNMQRDSCIFSGKNTKPHALNGKNGESLSHAPSGFPMSARAPGRTGDVRFVLLGHMLRAQEGRQHGI
jgi:hypothetical protein